MPDLGISTQLTNKNFVLLLSGALSPKLYFESTKCQKGQSQWLCG
jgi:hypothetical protein